MKNQFNKQLLIIVNRIREKINNLFYVIGYKIIIAYKIRIEYPPRYYVNLNTFEYDLGRFIFNIFCSILIALLFFPVIF